jgi:diaminopropionate ammonia-lyase
VAERLVVNPGAGRLDPAPPPSGPPAFHRALPGYAVTSLVEAPAAAAALGVRRVLVKDESSRLGLPSFKVLGASWAIYRVLCERLGLALEPVVPLDRLGERLAGGVSLVCATDGNHGRAVARMAEVLGLRATVLVPSTMVEARRAAIAGEGARVEVVDGTYDDAVEQAAGLAGPDRLVIQDTAWPGYETVPAWVIEGYSTIGSEIDVRPDVVAVQIGVGSFAAAMVGRFAGARIVGVEPVSAACALASAEAGTLTEVPGPHDSSMAGLNCGRPSPVAWPLLSRGIEAFSAVTDERADEAVALLAADGITAGESGAAGLAGLLAFHADLALPADATVLVVNTEGNTKEGLSPLT